MRPRSGRDREPALTVEEVLRLQRLCGNRAVLRLLRALGLRGARGNRKEQSPEPPKPY
jgi:hypothetical protein